MPLWQYLNWMNRGSIMSSRREKAIKRRRKFIALCVICLVVLIILITLAVVFIKKAAKTEDMPKDTSSLQSEIVSSQNDSSETESYKNEQKKEKKNEMVKRGKYTLDASFSRLLLVNGKNPLPDSYDSDIRASLKEIDAKYRNNNYVTKIHKDVYPYICAMVSAAQSDGVDLRVWSPFRSYADQQVLFNNQVNRVGGDEELAATVVARPGTSEHNTGICADFNMADDAFESTPMYKWMCENAEDYGFILRYPKDKQNVTGVIYESWHWRFVGINTAKEINAMGVTLEEYVEQKGLEPQAELNESEMIID